MDALPQSQIADAGYQLVTRRSMAAVRRGVNVAQQTTKMREQMQQVRTQISRERKHIWEDALSTCRMKTAIVMPMKG